MDLYSLSSDREFAKEFVLVWLEEQGSRVSADPKRADVRLKVFISVLGVDEGLSFLGIPSFKAPILDFPVPEVPLFKSLQHRGRAEVQVYTYDGQTGGFVEKSSPGIGNAKYDDYTVLLFVNFNVNDLD